MSSTKSTTATGGVTLDAGVAPPVWARGLIAAGVAAVANTAIYLIGTAAGADMAVDMAGTAVTITLVMVLAATMLPLALAGAVTWLLARRHTATRIVLAWVGLAIAVATVPVPLLFAPQSATGWTLVTMHLIAGVAWLASLLLGTGRRRA